MMQTSLQRCSVAAGRVVLLCVMMIFLATPGRADGGGGAGGAGGTNGTGETGGIGGTGGAGRTVGIGGGIDDYDYNNPEPAGPGYDETSIFINVQRVGGMEIPAVIKDRTVYLPITNLFDFLKIKNNPSIDLDSVTGFYIDPSSTFCIDNMHNRITYRGKIYDLRPDDMISTGSNLYLKQDLFNFVFGLTCYFDFANLTVRVSASYDLPAVKEMQLEQMHRNINRLKGEIKADTIIKRSYPAFRMGMADWSITSGQQSNGSKDLRASLAIGTLIAGGEANVFLNYSSSEPFSSKRQFYQWRFANNDRKVLRQITLGKVFTQATSSIFAPVVGVQVTNTPTTYRRSFGTYRLTKTTEPGWTVELYVNNVLVDYAKADASGFFSFDVPLVYGNSVVKLRYYGLYGEMRTVEENITIPFNFLPVNELEYTASAGIVEDGRNSRFARTNVNYGLSRKITIGGGAEYLSSLESNKAMPFMQASMRATSNLMLSAEYTMGVRGKAMLAYRMPFNAQLELNYTKYAKDQKAIIYNYLEERKVTVTVPFRGKKFGALTRLMLNQTLITNNTSSTTGEWLVSGTFRNVSANINTYLISTGQNDPPLFDPYVYSNVSLGYRLKKGYTLTPQLQYGFKDREVISVKAEMEKFLFSKGYVNLSFEQNFKSNTYSIGAGIRYDLSFARFGVSARQFNDGLSLTESASGSLVYDPKTAYKSFDNRPAVGRAGITILAYLDVNGNGSRDAGEPKVDGLKVRINSGRIEYSKQDTIVRLSDLEPYNNYFIDISQNSFENIGWQIVKKTMNVAVDPNMFKLIEVPVVVMSEAAGRVSLKADGDTKGQGRINVCFYKLGGVLAGCTTSDADGYFSYMGLSAGTYTVRLDEAQLERLDMKAFPASSDITILPSRDGTLLDDIDFTIQSTNPVSLLVH